MTYRTELRPAAARALRKLDPAIRPRIQGAIGHSPTTRGRRHPDLCEVALVIRVRVGDYRTVYTIDDDVLLIVVVALGHRREVYDR